MLSKNLGKIVNMLQKKNNLTFSNWKKLNIAPKNKVLKIYNNLVKGYFNLDKKYKFNQEISKKYIFRQINKINTKKTQLKFLPIGIKDNINTKDLSTNFGLKNKRRFKIGTNARIVDKIIEKGGIIFSKTKCAEFAVHYINKNFNLNPHDKKHIAGTSSTGSAISVATGALPLALGTQTAGSIIRPASYCGVYGFKPTYGSIDRTGILKTNDLYDTVGVLASEIEYVKIFFKEIIDINNNYPWTKKFYLKKNLFKIKKKIKIGYINDHLKIYNKATNEIKIFYSQILKNLNDKYNCKIFKNKYLNQFHRLHEVTYSKSLSYYIKTYIKKKNQISKSLQNIIKKGEKISTQKYNIYLKDMNEYKNSIKKEFSNFDFLILPSTFSRAPRVGSNELKDTSLIWTAIGYPCINIPIKYPSSKLPYGLMVVSTDYNDLALLDFAKMLDKLLKKKL
tara:strand:+ start:10216 stop:11565 length:1350 start_codon:yes stop_codon:yes gene_type:complete